MPEGEPSGRQGEEKKTAVKADILPLLQRSPSPLSFGHLPTLWGVTYGSPSGLPLTLPLTPSCQLLLSIGDSRPCRAIARATCTELLLIGTDAISCVGGDAYIAPFPVYVSHCSIGRPPSHKIRRCERCILRQIPNSYALYGLPSAARSSIDNRTDPADARCASLRLVPLQRITSGPPKAVPTNAIIHGETINPAFRIPNSEFSMPVHCNYELCIMNYELRPASTLTSPPMYAIMIPCNH